MPLLLLIRIIHRCEILRLRVRLMHIKTYRNYFNVYTAFPLSTESGVGTVNTIRYNRFNTTFTGGVCLKADYAEVFDYSLGAQPLASS